MFSYPALCPEESSPRLKRQSGCQKPTGEAVFRFPFGLQVGCNYIVSAKQPEEKGVWCSLVSVSGRSSRLFPGNLGSGGRGPRPLLASFSGGAGPDSPCCKVTKLPLMGVTCQMPACFPACGVLLSAATTKCPGQIMGYTINIDRGSREVKKPENHA